MLDVPPRAQAEAADCGSIEFMLELGSGSTYLNGTCEERFASAEDMGDLTG